ncbi:conserved hypothetical protein [Ricinus communis]|uniref:Uncharacterized protein n=1 Tax=Ricinus communis TaxID=3988 RepID=B9SFK6_RICCO|nr:conserved hypothetical protein [Ricinus communis]
MYGNQIDSGSAINRMPLRAPAHQGIPANSKLYDSALGDDSSSEEEVVSALGRDKGPEKPKENPIGLKNGKGIKEKGLDEGTKADIRRR